MKFSRLNESKMVTMTSGTGGQEFRVSEVDGHTSSLLQRKFGSGFHSGVESRDSFFVFLIFCSFRMCILFSVAMQIILKMG